MIDNKTKWATTERIRKTLGENGKDATHQIATIGPDQALALLNRTLEIEAAGATMLPDGSRRRTPGGAYLRLVKDSLPPEQHAIIWPSWREKKARRKARTAALATATADAAAAETPQATETPA